MSETTNSTAVCAIDHSY